jgi:hypothetical protein
MVAMDKENGQDMVRNTMIPQDTSIGNGARPSIATYEDGL